MMQSVSVCVAMLFIVQLIQCPCAGELEKPNNISCKILNFTKMVCSWEPFPPSLKADCSLKYGVQCKRKCSFMKTVKLNRRQKELEVWNEKSESPYRLHCNQCVQLIGKSNTKIIKPGIARFRPEDIVELNPVDITNVRVTDTNIYIKWKEPMIQRPTVCDVKYAAGRSLLQTKTKRTTSCTDIELTELSPSTMYCISIRWKFETSKFWSNEKYINTSTNHAVLKSGPVILQGAFVKYKCPLPNRTCLIIYWKPLQGSLAKTEFYEISNCLPRENVHCNIKRVGANKNCLEMADPDFQIKSIFIRAKTEIGYSPYSMLTFNQDRSVPQKVTNLKVEETEDPHVLSISWSHEQSNSTEPLVTNVTILWCHGKKTFTDALVVDCEDKMDSITVIANGSYVLRLRKTIDVKRFHVAIILNSKTGSQEMTWSECVFTRTGYINDPKLPLIITTFPKKILVQWYPVECQITLLPLVYQVAYTKQTQKRTRNPCSLGSLVNVSISRTKVELKNLQRNQFYYICIRIVTVVGPTPFSRPYLKKTSILSKKRVQFPPNLYSANTTTTQRTHPSTMKEKGVSKVIMIFTYIVAIAIFMMVLFWFTRKQCCFKVEIFTPKIIKYEYEECSVNDGTSNELKATKYKHVK